MAMAYFLILLLLMHTQAPVLVYILWAIGFIGYLWIGV